jgi:mono/diheme cytochrome c family protein/glucose/arabinose dehydrogenase
MPNKIHCFLVVIAFASATCSDNDDIDQTYFIENSVHSKDIESFEADRRVIKDPTTVPLPAEQSIKTFRVPKGYRLELVASEPLISEPASITWDGNGYMYVAQLETYMQTVEGKDQYGSTSRIMRLEDNNHDGRMDKSTVFIDKLVAPRAMLCIGNELFVNETNSFNIYAYSDINNDGIADKKRAVFETDQKAFGNIEHQRSGFDWNIDNWIYITTDPVRYKYKNGKLLTDSLPYGNNGQWGLTHDNYGRLYYSRGGAQVPVCGYNINPVYGQLDIADTRRDSIFNAVWPIIKTPDTNNPLRSDSTLTVFTAACGQSIFRGDRLPAGLIGDYFVAEPVGRLIRRASITEHKGIRTLENIFESDEFITSTDMNFRPVNTYTGPDGYLYIVDMYRGIIQEATWAQPGSAVFAQIKSKNLDANIKRGRIYRLVHEDFRPGSQPQMLKASLSTLVSFLDHPNGWWRDNAQKEIVYRNDTSVVPSLRAIASGQQANLSRKPSGLARLHALWTLEGLGSITKKMLMDLLVDDDVQMRIAAIRLSEPYIKQNDTGMLDLLSRLKDDSNNDLKVQLVNSLQFGNGDVAHRLLAEVLRENACDQIFIALEKTLAKNEDAKRYGSTLSSLPDTARKLVIKGAQIFKTNCAACHGEEGKGLSTQVAPPLINKFKLIRYKDGVIDILLNGLKGPVDNRSYNDVMPAMRANDDEWIASVLSYVRYDLCMRSFPQMPASYVNMVIVKPEQVKALRDKRSGRTEPWTWAEIENEYKRNQRTNNK